MDMSKESNEVVLCVSNAYQKKFYLNENFNGLPQSIRDELKNHVRHLHRGYRWSIGAGI